MSNDRSLTKAEVGAIVDRMRACVVGIGHTNFGRWLDRSLASLSQEAARQALEDAGLGPADVGMVAFGNAGQGAIEGQHSIRGVLALRELGLGRVPIVNVDNACAGASTAFHVACAWVEAGMADVVLAVGAEKMVTPDKERAFAMLGGSWDVSDVAGTLARLRAMGEGVVFPPEEDGPPDRSPFMDVYAGFARFHMKTFGSTRAQLAAIAAKNHAHSQHNPLAHYRRPFTREEVLAGRPVVYPFTVPMCSPVSDGAAAAVIVSEKRVAQLGRARAVRIRAALLASGDARRPPENVREHVCHLLAKRAYEAAGIGPEDVSFAEVHDATAFGEIVQAENLGFCAFGDGGVIAERGETSIGGRIPINPSGGLESRGHPVGATGLAQIHELVTQLRGEAGARQVAGANVGVAENGGGLVGIEEGAASIIVLSR